MTDSRTSLTSTALNSLTLLITIIFGAFAIRAFNAAAVANTISQDSLSASWESNRQAQIANTLSLWTICQGNLSPMCLAFLHETRIEMLVQTVNNSLPVQVPITPPPPQVPENSTVLTVEGLEEVLRRLGLGRVKNVSKSDVEDAVTWGMVWGAAIIAIVAFLGKIAFQAFENRVKAEMRNLDGRARNERN